MNEEAPLYEDVDLRVSSMPNSPQDHYIVFTAGDTENSSYALQRGILEELANAPRYDFRSKIDMLHPSILTEARSRGLTADSLHAAINLACAENERRVQKYLSEIE